MNKSYIYEEYKLYKQEILNNTLNTETILKFIFHDKVNNENILILENKLILIENKDNILETKIIKFLKNNNNINHTILYHNYEMLDDDIFNIDLVMKILCNTNTGLLYESVCGFKEMNNNTLSIKLWRDEKLNYYAGVSTSYNVDEIYDYVIVGAGPSGIYTAYNIGKNNPNARILLLEGNSKTLEDYKSKGYDKVDKWNMAQLDNDFQKSYISEDKKTIWVGKGLGGGTLHFGLQYINNISKNYEDWKETNYDIIDNDLKALKYSYEMNNNIYTPNEAWFNLNNNLLKYGLNNEINIYNNPVYCTNFENKDRLLLGDLLNNLTNITILYNKKMDKIVYKNYQNKEAEAIKTFDNKYYKGKTIILCCGALETPSILQRSNVDCGNKLYDHGGLVGLTYGKLNTPAPTESPPDELKPNTFKLNVENIKIINEVNDKYIFITNGNNIPEEDKNNVYDFTDWVLNHPGGRFNIIKWKDNDYELIYPHDTFRWVSSKSKFPLIGKKDEIITYENLPDYLKSEKLYEELFKKSKNINLLIQEDLGFEPEKIISHLQTRDNELKWQTYYSTVPGLNNFLILTHAQSTNIEGKGQVKINSNKDENPKIVLNHFGDNKEEVINNLLDAYNKNHNFLVSNGYVLLNPSPIEKPITREYIENNIDSIYHYHGSCAIGEVVNENQRLMNVENVYIGDISVLNKPWGGSTSYACLNTALNVSKNFIKKM